MMFNFDLFVKITKDLPEFDKSNEKEEIPKEIREIIKQRDKNTCKLCGTEGSFGHYMSGGAGNIFIHHIIPNGASEPDNLLILCKTCHQLVHIMLYKLGKWKWVFFRWS